MKKWDKADKIVGKHKFITVRDEMHTEAPASIFSPPDYASLVSWHFGFLTYLQNKLVETAWFALMDTDYMQHLLFDNLQQLSLYHSGY